MVGTLFGYGDIFILSGNDLKGEVFNGIQEPETVKEEILSRSHHIETGRFHDNFQDSLQTEKSQRQTEYQSLPIHWDRGSLEYVSPCLSSRHRQCKRSE